MSVDLCDIFDNESFDFKGKKLAVMESAKSHYYIRRFAKNETLSRDCWRLNFEKSILDDDGIEDEKNVAKM